MLPYFVVTEINFPNAAYDEAATDQDHRHHKVMPEQASTSSLAENSGKCFQWSPLLLQYRSLLAALWFKPVHERALLFFLSLVPHAADLFLEFLVNLAVALSSDIFVVNL